MGNNLLFISILGRFLYNWTSREEPTLQDFYNYCMSVQHEYSPQPLEKEQDE